MDPLLSRGGSNPVLASSSSCSGAMIQLGSGGGGDICVPTSCTYL